MFQELLRNYRNIIHQKDQLKSTSFPISNYSNDALPLKDVISNFVFEKITFLVMYNETILIITSMNSVSLSGFYYAIDFALRIASA